MKLYYKRGREKREEGGEEREKMVETMLVEELITEVMQTRTGRGGFVHVPAAHYGGTADGDSQFARPWLAVLAVSIAQELACSAQCCVEVRVLRTKLFFALRCARSQMGHRCHVCQSVKSETVYGGSQNYCTQDR